VLVVVVAQGFGGAVPVRPALLADDFGIRYFGAIHGILFLVTGVGAFFGPVTVGWIVDTTGDYRMGWLVAATMSVLAIPAILASGRPTALLDRYGPPTNTLIPSHQAQVLLPQQSEP
jgi:MFS family permease